MRLPETEMKAMLLPRPDAGNAERPHDPQHLRQPERPHRLLSGLQQTPLNDLDEPHLW
jgi:hypothetical protein